MTQQEFETRTKVNVSATEFETINAFYMSCEADKDEFCKMWCKMNPGKVKAAKVERIIAEREQAKRDFAWGIVNNGYTWEEMCELADNHFSKHQKSFLEVFFGIEMQATNSYGIRYFRSVSDVLYDLNKYLCPNA